jgi:hypothetical protein
MPTFIVFDPTNNQFVLNINSPSNVGLYKISMQGTIGNNKTSEVKFTIKVQSPCFGLQVNVPTISIIPIYDISDLVPLHINLDWTVVNPPTPSCSPPFFNFKIVNSTLGGSIDPNIFTIVTNAVNPSDV